MGKYREPKREYSSTQHDREEIRNLKRLVAHLRKELDRARNRKFEAIKDHLDEKDSQDDPEEKSEEPKWRCFKCGDGVLRLVVYETRVGAKYFRKCDCGHRTKSQPYTDKVEK